MAAGLGFFVTVGVMLRLARSHNALHMRTMLVAEERKALVEELNAQRREAQRASVAKTFFLASVSHDLRQPMHSIALLVAAARRRGVAEAETIEQIEASVQAMDTLLSALLEVAKLDSGAVPLQIRTVPVAEVLPPAPDRRTLRVLGPDRQPRRPGRLRSSDDRVNRVRARHRRP